MKLNVRYEKKKRTIRKKNEIKRTIRKEKTNDTKKMKLNER